MPRNTSVTIGEHFSSFIDSKIEEGRFESTSEAVRAGLRLLEEDEAKLTAIRAKLTVGEAQLDRGEFVNGDEFIKKLIAKRG
ncbi:MAG: antitoxin ParD1/3/4 [Paraglaciecola sp.]|jgi:antitoxin ParD1/3/4